MIDSLQSFNTNRNQTEWKAALQRIMIALETSVESTLDGDYIKAQLDEMERLLPTDEILEIDIGEAFKATLKKIKQRKIQANAKIVTINMAEDIDNSYETFI